MSCVVEKSKFLCQLHCNQILNHVILSLWHLQSHCLTLIIFANIFHLQRDLGRGLSHSKMQVSDKLADYTFELVRICRTLRKIWIYGVLTKRGKLTRINNMGLNELKIILIFMTFVFEILLFL